MHELTSIREVLTRIAKLDDEITALRSDKYKQEIRERYAADTGGSIHTQDIYPHMFGALAALAGIAARDAKYALKTVTLVQETVAPMERLQAVMENFDVMANNGCVGGEDNTRELRLLELICTDDEYREYRRELREEIHKQLNFVEDVERDYEKEQAEEKLNASGFVQVERDDFEGWERASEQVTIEMTHDRYHNPTGYSFSYDNGDVAISGVSGEFSKLLGTIDAGQQKPAETVQTAPTTQSGTEDKESA